MKKAFCTFKREAKKARKIGMKLIKVGKEAMRK